MNYASRRVLLIAAAVVAGAAVALWLGWRETQTPRTREVAPDRVGGAPTDARLPKHPWGPGEVMIDDERASGDKATHSRAVAVLHGIVTASGQAVAHFSVSVYGPTIEHLQIHDTNGHFSFEGLQPGTCELVATSSARSGRAFAIVDPSRDVAVDIVLEDDGVVTGRVVDGHGRPVGGAAVLLSPRYGGVGIHPDDPSTPPITTSDGHFVVTSDAGPRTLSLLSVGGVELHLEVDVRSGQTVEVGTLTMAP